MVSALDEQPVKATSRKHAERIARAMQRELRADGLGSAEARARRIDGVWHVSVDVPVDDAAHWLGTDA